MQSSYPVGKILGILVPLEMASQAPAVVIDLGVVEGDGTKCAACGISDQKCAEGTRWFGCSYCPLWVCEHCHTLKDILQHEGLYHHHQHGG